MSTPTGISRQLPGLGLFRMELDAGRLPIQIAVSKMLHQYLDTHDFAAAAVSDFDRSQQGSDWQAE